MDITKIKVGKNPPEDINVIIEIPMRSDPIKYEFDKDSGAITVDRIQSAAMYYPVNYGFIPNTLGQDGDPIDVLVVADYPLLPGSVINVRPVGVIIMEDESGMDEKILAVPNYKLTKAYDNVKDVNDLPQGLLNSLKHFFEHYKDLEPGKWVKIGNTEGKESACNIINLGIKNFKK